MTAKVATKGLALLAPAYTLPLVNGVEATRQIRARLPRMEVLIFTMHDNEVSVLSPVLRVMART